MVPAERMLPSSSLARFTLLIVEFLAILTSPVRGCRTVPYSCHWSSTDNGFELRCHAFTVSRSGTDINIRCTADYVIDYSELNNMCVGSVYHFIISYVCRVPTMPLNRSMSSLVKVVLDTEFDTTVKQQFFRSLQKVTNLHVRTNSIIRLHPDIFIDMPQLTHIDLYGDSIDLPKNLFDRVPQLESLKLDSNNVTILHTIDLYNLKHLRDLYLWGNIRNLSRNFISGLQSLESLDISSTTIDIPPDLFVDLIHLRKITISKNKLLSLHETLFKNNINLVTLILQDDRSTPKTLPSRLLANLTKLEEVILISCNMSSLDEDLLWDLKSIRVVNLNKNAFTSLPEQLFKDSWSLEVLDLSFNKIRHLPIRLFLNTTNLKVLKLNNNLLDHLPNFEPLSILKTLNLANNKLIHIDAEVCGKVVNLQEVNLSNNMLTFEGMEMSPLHNCSNLQKLQLANNSLTKILTDWRELEFLKQLDLSYNKISEIHEADFYFSGTGNIIIDIRYNNISEIVTVDIDRIYKSAFKTEKISVPVKYFYIEGNPISCGCQYNSFYLYDGDQIITNITLIYESKFGNGNLQCVHPETYAAEVTNFPMNFFSCLFKKDFSINCPKECNCLFRPSDTALLVDCYQKNITSLPEVLPILNFSSYTELNLSGNRINSAKSALGPGYYKVTNYILSENMISEIDLSSFSILLQEADSYFNGTRNITVDLRNNNISEIVTVDIDRIYKSAFETQKTNVPVKYFYIEGNPISCSCQYYSFFLYDGDQIITNIILIYENKFVNGNLQCVHPETYAAEVTNFPMNFFSCLFKKDFSINCPKECNCLFRPSDTALLVDCYQKNIASLPEVLPILNFSSYTELNLSGNRIKSIKSLLGLGYNKVTKYFLSDNRISEINLSAFSLHIQVLDVDGNNIREFSGSFTEFLTNTTNLTQLTLHKNPWRCDCTTYNFVSVLQSHYTASKLYSTTNLKKIKLLENVTCENGVKILSIVLQELCSIKPKIVDIVSITIAALGFLLLLLGIFIALYSRFQKEIQVWLFAHHCCLGFITQEEMDQDKVYDAFVSYSHQDEDFVADHLVPGLEDGSYKYKLCLHQRDWIAGEFIPTQIIRSVEQSRRTIVVLSRAFVESVWGKMEFRVAHCQALRERCARVIIILYGEIGPTDKIEPELRAYLTMNTYLKWGDPYFWDKLYYALPRLSQIENEIPLQHMHHVTNNSDSSDGS